MATIDPSVGPTETKYIKLKIKTKNNIVIFGFFSKKRYCYFGFFLKDLTEIRVFKKISSFSFSFFSFLVFRLSKGQITTTAASKKYFKRINAQINECY